MRRKRSCAGRVASQGSRPASAGRDLRRTSESCFSQPLEKVLLRERSARRGLMQSTPKPPCKSFEDTPRSKLCGGDRALHGVSSVCFDSGVPRPFVDAVAPAWITARRERNPIGTILDATTLEPHARRRTHSRRNGHAAAPRHAATPAAPRGLTSQSLGGDLTSAAA